MPPTEAIGATEVRVLGWTLLHFLWQGAVVAAVLGVSLWLTKRSRSTLRYALAAGSLLTLSLLPVGTFAVLTGRHEAEGITYPLTSGIDWEARSASAAPSEERSGAFIVGARFLRPALEPYLPYLVMAWGLGVVSLSVRLLGGLWVLRKLKTRFSRPASRELNDRFHHLLGRIGIKRNVTLNESVAARVPLVIGWVRPVVLLPASAISGLTIGQLELILAHELAHVRRHDYLINLLQNIVETVLFYHPAVWWISSKVREERELCCDDVAVRACDGNKLSYAKALLRLDDVNMSRLAPAATGGSLLKRVKRLVNSSPPRDPIQTHWLAALSSLAMPVLSLALAGSMHHPGILLGTYEAGPYSMVELTQAGFPVGLACENSGPWLLVLTELGFFSGNVDEDPGCRYQNPFVKGSWTLQGDRLTFRDSQDLGCGLGEYSYRYRLRDDTLSLTPIDDSCAVRIYILSTRTWKRA